MGSAGSGAKFIEAHQMWFTFVTARLFFSVSFQLRLAATLLTSCSVVNSPTQRVGLSPTFRPVSLAQHSRNSRMKSFWVLVFGFWCFKIRVHLWSIYS